LTNIRKLGNYRFRQRQISKLIKRFRLEERNDLKVLDVGCGFDPVSLYFNSREKTVLLDIDTKIENVDIYDDIDKPNYRFPFPDKFFDIIILTDVLAHIKNKDRVLSECKRVGKMLVLSTVNVSTMRHVYRRITGRDVEPMHVSEVSYDKLLDLVKKHYKKCYVLGYSLQLPFLSTVYACFPTWFLNLIEYIGERIPEKSAKILVMCTD